MKYRRIALIPAYEPDGCLIDIVNELNENRFTVIIVNDGSSASCAEIFGAVSGNAEVIVHVHNHGKGKALRTGLEYIQRNYIPPYAVVTLDADGQHSIKDAIKVIDEACEMPGNLVIGSRDFKGRVPMRSLIGNTLTRFVFRVSAGRGVRDTQTGLRAFSHRHIERMLSISGERYEYEMNVLMDYAKSGENIIEVPIETIYRDDNSSSHFDTVRDSYRIYKEILKFSASSLVCFCVDYALFCAFSAISGSAAASNISARIFSSVMNYDINRRFVFGSRSSVKKSVLQYFTLASFILICNTALLTLLLSTTLLNRYTAKLITEAIMFILSWTVQKTLIFRKSGAKING